MAQLEIHNVTVEYLMKRTGQRVTAVQGASFTVERGQLVAIVGPSGCGKTTLLNVIAGLLPITAGTVRLNGREISGPGRERAVVFQSAALMPWRSVLRNVTYGLELQGRSKRNAQATAQKFIDLVGLNGFEGSFPRELSGGMQQRVNLARALAVEPELLLLDEPLAALDAQSREYMQLELLRIWRQTGHTAIYITHQINEAVYLADKVIVMSARPGRIKATIPIDLPRPRSLELKRQPPFVAYEDQIWGLLREEARQMGMMIQT